MQAHTEPFIAHNGLHNRKFSNHFSILKVLPPYFNIATQFYQFETLYSTIIYVNAMHL